MDLIFARNDWVNMRRSEGAYICVSDGEIDKTVDIRLLLVHSWEMDLQRGDSIFVPDNVWVGCRYTGTVLFQDLNKK